MDLLSKHTLFCDYLQDCVTFNYVLVLQIANFLKIISLANDIKAYYKSCARIFYKLCRLIALATGLVATVLPYTNNYLTNLYIKLYYNEY